MLDGYPISYFLAYILEIFQIVSRDDPEEAEEMPRKCCWLEL